MKSGQELLVGVGDSSFCQLPCPWATWSREVDDHSTTSTSTGTSDDVGVHTIACGATTSFCVSGHITPSLLEWGTSLYGERLSPATIPPLLNHPASVSFSSLPLRLPSIPPAIRHIACGAHFVVVSLETGGCISWGGGREARRALGRGGCGTCGACCRKNGSSTPVAAGHSKPDWVAEPLGIGGLKVADLAAGDDHAIAVCTDGSAWAWGRGDCGQLGCSSGPPADGNGGSACVPMPVRVPSPSRPLDSIGGGDAQGRRSGPIAIRASCGRDHSALLTDDGRLWTFGSGLHGQLGLGTVGEISWTPEMVDSLEGVGTMRPDGSFTGLMSVACGAWHTAALSTTGDVYTWGWARFGALGPSPPVDGPFRRTKQDGSTDPTSGKAKFIATSSTAVAVTEEGEVRPYPGLVDGLDGLLLDNDDQLASVSCGARYTLAMSRKKRAFVWGQVAPPLQHDGRKRGGGTSGAGDGTGSPLESFSRPREMKPAELLRAGARSKSLNAGELGRGCCSDGNIGSASEVPADDGDGSRWEVSAVGCGPWYIVFGLQQKELQGKEGQSAVGDTVT